MIAKGPVQPAVEDSLASVTIEITRAGRTRVLYESVARPPANMPAKKAPAFESDTSSHAKSAGGQKRAKPKAKKQSGPSDEELKAEVTEAIQAITFDSKDVFEPEASIELYRNKDGKKTHFVTGEYIKEVYPDQKLRGRVLALMKGLGWLISGPHEIKISGIKCLMYKMDLKAINASETINNKI